MSKQFKTGLTLSGGAARGLAHLGVAKALYEDGIYPDCISGSSAGSIAGAFLADGYDPEELLGIFNKKRLFEFVDVALNKKGLLKIAGLKKLLKKHLRATTFEELKKVLFVACTNLNSGKVEYFNKGNIVEKVIASSSIPVLFPPVEMNKALFADGGIIDNLPVKPIRNKCEKLIGVHVNYIGPEEKIDSLIKIAVRSFHLGTRSKVELASKECDIFIEPEELKEYGFMDVGKGIEMFDIGYKTTKEILRKQNIL